MRLTWRDGLATLLVAAAAVLYALWAAGRPYAGCVHPVDDGDRLCARRGGLHGQPA